MRSASHLCLSPYFVRAGGCRNRWPWLERDLKQEAGGTIARPRWMIDVEWQSIVRAVKRGVRSLCLSCRLSLWVEVLRTKVLSAPRSRME